MTRAMAPTTLATIFMTLFVVGTAPTARADEPRACSNASLRGSFGFTSQGALVANFPPPVLGPFGEIGRQTFDGRGNTEGAATLSGNGNINRVTFQGTYIVNPDCTQATDPPRLSVWVNCEPGLRDRRRRERASGDRDGGRCC
jgi:hypothetical protein